jgi:hypothetical protein
MGAYKEEERMAIVLDHTIVPARDKEESARFFARIFGLEYNGPVSHFAPVRVNDTLTVDFDNWDSFERHHYASKSARRSLTASLAGSALRLSSMAAARARPRTCRSIIAMAVAVFTSATPMVTCSKC